MLTLSRALPTGVNPSVETIVAVRDVKSAASKANAAGRTGFSLGKVPEELLLAEQQNAPTWQVDPELAIRSLQLGCIVSDRANSAVIG